MFEELKKIGLSENEAKVYVALLELGSATVQQIAQKAGVNRPTTYVQLSDLSKMGLVSSFEKGKKTFFRAEDPENLKTVIEKEKRALLERETILQTTIDELRRLFALAGERPRVRFFEGIEGLRAMQKDFLKTKDKDIEAVSAADDLVKIFPQHLKEYVPERVKKRIFSHLIYTSSQGPFLKASDKSMFRESKLVPAEKFPFSSDIAIYENKVAISALKGRPIGVIIENQEIANTLKALFYLAWEAAEKY